MLADAGSSPAVQSKTYLERSRPMLPSRPKRMYVTRVLCCWSSHLFVDRTRWKQKQYTGVRRKPDSRVYLAVDNPKRGPGRHSKGFAMSRLLQSVQRAVRSNPALNMQYTEIDGHQSTKQAAPVPCFFSEQRADKRNPCVADLAGLPSERTAQGPSWSAMCPPPDRYKCRYDPIHMAV